MPRPKKTFKSLDDDADVTDILKEATIEPDEEDDVTLDGVPPEDLECSEKDEVQVEGGGDDMSVSIGSVRSNRPPPKIWSDNIKTKFVCGDLVTMKGYPDQIYKITGMCDTPYTYSIKPSGSDTDRLNIPEDKLKKAKPDAAWISYWDTVKDPYREWLKKKEAEKKTIKPVTIKIKKKKK